MAVYPEHHYPERHQAILHHAFLMHFGPYRTLPHGWRMQRLTGCLNTYPPWPRTLSAATLARDATAGWLAHGGRVHSTNWASPSVAYATRCGSCGTGEIARTAGAAAVATWLMLAEAACDCQAVKSLCPMSTALLERVATAGRLAPGRAAVTWHLYMQKKIDLLWKQSAGGRLRKI